MQLFSEAAEMISLVVESAFPSNAVKMLLISHSEKKKSHRAFENIGGLAQ